MQHQKLLQEAATSAEALAQDAQQHQQDTSEENSALKQEIQASAYRPSLSCHVTACGKLLSA